MDDMVAGGLMETCGLAGDSADELKETFETRSSPLGLEAARTDQREIAAPLILLYVVTAAL